MRYYEIIETILTELVKTADIQFGNFTIRHSVDPDQSGIFSGLGFHNKDRDIKTDRISGSSVEEVVNKVKDALRLLRYEQAKERKPDIKLSDVQRSEAAFNVDFTNEILEGVPTAVRFGTEGGHYVDVASREYFEEFPDELKKEGFTRLSLLIRSKRSEGGTKSYHTALTPAKVESLGLDFNGRYTLERDTSIQDDMFTRYRMHLDSHVSNPNDAFTLGVPGVTIAAWLKKSDEEHDDLAETATAGASSAGSVATVVGGLGAGFDPNGDWRSIYSTKKPSKPKKDKMAIIRRPPIVESNLPDEFNINSLIEKNYPNAKKRVSEFRKLVSAGKLKNEDFTNWVFKTVKK